MTKSEQLLADGWLRVTPVDPPQDFRVIAYCADHHHVLGGVYRVGDSWWHDERSTIPIGCRVTHYRAFNTKGSGEE